MLISFVGIIRLVVCLAITVGSFSFVSGAAAATLVNGGFETTFDEFPGYGFHSNLEGNELYGWEIVSGNVDHIGSFWVASEGALSLNLNGYTSGKIQQSFATTPGQYYSVLFDFAANPDPSFQPMPIAYMVVAAGSQSANYQFDPAGHSFANMGWTEMTFDFLAIGGTTTLSFQSLTPGLSGPALDNIRVVEVVPEVSSLAMISVACAGSIVVFCRRKA